MVRAIGIDMETTQANTAPIFTICGTEIDTPHGPEPRVSGIFYTLADATAAWIAAGKPQHRHSSVWVNEDAVDSDGIGRTVRTITLAR